jgi:hypothetical protein
MLSRGLQVYAWNGIDMLIWYLFRKDGIDPLYDANPKALQSHHQIVPSL